MSIEKGDYIAVTVPKDWADAVVPALPLHYLKDHDTANSRLFGAKLVSVESQGLWVESANDPEGINDPDKILVQWRYVLAIQTSRALQAKRTPIGFANLEKLPT